MKLLFCKAKKTELPVFQNTENPRNLSFFEKFGNYVESSVEKQLKERESGRFRAKHIEVACKFPAIPLFCLLIAFSLIVVLNEPNPKKKRPDLLHRLFAIGIGMLSPMIQLHMSSEADKTTKEWGTNFTFTFYQVCPRFIANVKSHFIVLAIIPTVYYAVTVCLTTFKVYDIFALIGLVLSIVAALFLPYIEALKKFNNENKNNNENRTLPEDGNYSRIKTETRLRDKGILRILDSTKFKITIQNISEEPFLLSRVRLCRVSNVFDLPSYEQLPQQIIQLVPEDALYDGECVRVLGIRNFGMDNGLQILKTELYWISETNEDHSQDDIVAELTEYYAMVKTEETTVNLNMMTPT